MPEVYRLRTVPTIETIQYLKDITSGTSTTYDDFANMSVDIMISKYLIVPMQNVVYRLNCGYIGVFYDSARKQSSLLLPLYSVGIQNRFNSLCNLGVLPFWYSGCKPYMTLIDNCPPLKRGNKGYINSISGILVEQTLVFQSEVCTLEDQEFPKNFDYLSTANEKHLSGPLLGL